MVVPLMAIGSTAGGLMLTGCFGLLTAFVFRGGLLLRLFGIAVVTKHGKQVSRLRALGRAFVAWAPLPLCVFGAFRLTNGLSAWPAVLLAGGLVFPAGAVWAIWHPERGLQDRIARTWLVPR